MLKWTASAHRLSQGAVTPTADLAKTALSLTRTPRPNVRPRQQRRATIATQSGNNNTNNNFHGNVSDFWFNHCSSNKENIPVTSTPMVPTATASPLRMRNSPLVLAPFTDILNITPEASPVTARTRLTENAAQANHLERERQRRRSVISIAAQPIALTAAMKATSEALRQRRHSTVANSNATLLGPQYAATLPCYDEEEYSPSAKVLPTGQQLALRGIHPVPFLTTTRYFQTPQVIAATTNRTTTLPPQKRRLEQEFAEIAQENVATAIKAPSCPLPATMPPPPPHHDLAAANSTATLSSAKMGDQTLDCLIDAILDSARKEEKKKKPRKSFNLRRRTLLRNQAGGAQQEQLLSPSYAAGYDPASDLSFLLNDVTAPVASPVKQPKIAMPAKVQSPATPPTPEPATPPPGTPISDTVLRGMPTPAAQPATHTKSTRLLDHLRAFAKNDSFTLATPVRSLAKRRRAPEHVADATTATQAIEMRRGGDGTATKKFKTDGRNYFEVGLALPSIYV